VYADPLPAANVTEPEETFEAPDEFVSYREQIMASGSPPPPEPAESESDDGGDDDEEDDDEATRTVHRKVSWADFTRTGDFGRCGARR
jgi:hypothetical protein